MEEKKIETTNKTIYVSVQMVEQERAYCQKEIVKQYDDRKIDEKKLALELIEQEKYYCQHELLRLYNQGTITEKDIAVRFAELKKLLKSTYDNICEFDNLVNGIRK